MNITQKNTFETLKYGYIKPLTLMDDLEELIPGVTRNFNNHYDNEVRQAMYDKNHAHPSLGEPDGKIYRKQIVSRLSGNKPFNIGYEFFFLISDKNKKHNNVIMKATPTFTLNQEIEYKSTKKTEVTSKQHFFDLICDWQEFIQDRTDKIIEHLYNTTHNSNFFKVDRFYDTPYMDMDRDHERLHKSDCWKNDVENFIIKLHDSVQTMKEFG